ncbi:hypothetical protein OAR95_02100 [Pseudomonadales bacterium]|nr:hypothetical protein [Pseudomonadales bacterium]
MTILGGHMSHREGRVIHDADSHIIEGRGWLESYATEYVKDNLDTGVFDLNMPALDPIIEAADKRLAGQNPELTAALKSDIFAHPGKRNMWSAYGAVEKRERSDALSIKHYGCDLATYLPLSWRRSVCSIERS